MLKMKRVKFHLVKAGQTLENIAEAYSVSPFLLARENGLKTEPFIGQILRIPKETGDAYIVQEGDTKSLLCGGEESFAKKNGTGVFYLGMRVIL